MGGRKKPCARVTRVLACDTVVYLCSFSHSWRTETFSSGVEYRCNAEHVFDPPKCGRVLPHFGGVVWTVQL